MTEAKQTACTVMIFFMLFIALMSFSSLITRGNSANELVEHSLICTIPLENKPSRAVLSPNLTSCHRSFSDANKAVYCCPPKRNSEEPIIDFKFPDPSETIRVRRPAHLVDDEDLAKYQKALTIMKSLPYDDPPYNQEHSNLIFKIHKSWMFFPWHRMMLYFHERIPGSLIGDDTFALPFWNWDSPEGMVMPDMHMNSPQFDKERDTSHFAPRVTDNYYNEVDSGLGPEEPIKANVAFMYHQMVSGAKKMELFMGCQYRAGTNVFCNGLETAPHNTLHSWITFYAAARDPIFYAHHSNIDHVDDPDWLDIHFFFYNEKSQLVRIKFRDVLNITKLGYNYDSQLIQDISIPWINAQPNLSIPPKVARHMLKMRDNDAHSEGLLLFKPSSSLISDFGPKGRILDTILRVQVHRPKTSRTKMEKTIEEEADMYAKFDVYINAVDETTIGPESREFTGTFVNMRRGVNVVMNKGDIPVEMKTNIKLGISELLEDLEADDDDVIWVSLMGFGLST
ncbi:hypothetical protein MKX01_042165 [Papaver californicum]|nr:hypothetical protein MKX01_042165 [Papaver californicum]